MYAQFPLCDICLYQGCGFRKSVALVSLSLTIVHKYLLLISNEANDFPLRISKLEYWLILGPF
jgi:hypothetical protein